MMIVTPPRFLRHNRPRIGLRLLEPLEARTLLSAAILVTGNGAAIANHDLTPSIVDFTDFGPMSTTVSAAIGRVSRSFVIADTGNADLALTGGAKQIQITGTNAKDFVLTVNAAAAIPVGMQSGFTIAFVPKGTGLRKATVTILSNDPAAPTFTFNIQGTGLKTINSADGLQVATTVKGIGTAAINTTHITINYTGFLLNGTVFDSGYSPGNAPVQLTLNDPTIMQGWQEGFLGIKSGESRVLFVPAALSNGLPPHGTVPAGATLIFTVKALIPVVALSGNSVPIALADKTPSAADGTFIGATPAGSLAPLSFTFKISNGGAGKVGFPTLSLPVPTPVVVFTGKTAANFSASGLTFDSSFDFATFTVTYTPTKAGTQTAILHVRTSDPVHPDFTFTVSGTNTPYLDLSPTATGVINYPASGNIVSGVATKIKVPLTVFNFGNAAVPGTTAPMLINFYLHDTTSGTDTLIASPTVTSFRGTASGKSKLVNLNIIVPATVPKGSYKLLVKINENAAVAETSFLNNSVLSSQVVAVI